LDQFSTHPLHQYKFILNQQLDQSTSVSKLLNAIAPFEELNLVCECPVSC